MLAKSTTSQPAVVIELMVDVSPRVIHASTARRKLARALRINSPEIAARRRARLADIFAQPRVGRLCATGKVTAARGRTTKEGTMDRMIFRHLLAAACCLGLAGAA